MSHNLDQLTQIQWAPRSAGPKPTPLFLFHDGGGTILSYMFLDDVDRDVYGIQDRKFGTDDIWEEGLMGMATEYVGRVREVLGNGGGDVLLGGWSLGGMLAFQIAHLLDSDPTINVKALILIDSPYPNGWKSSPNVRPPIPTTSDVIRRNVQRRFEEAHRIVSTWDVPKTWQKPVAGAAKGFEYFALDEEPVRLEREEVAEGEGAGAPPPTLLFRATGSVPNMEGPVDASREQKLLGWEKYPCDFVRVVREVDASHYDIFQGEERLELLSRGIKDWCNEVDKMSSPKKV